MKYFSLVAGLMLFGSLAYAEPPNLPHSDLVRHHHPNEFRQAHGFRITDRGDDQRHQGDDHMRHRRVDRARDRDGFRLADRGGDHRRHGDDHMRNHRVQREHDRHWDRSWDRDRFRDRERSRVFFRPRFGFSESWLPRDRIFIRVRNHPYYYFGGTFYDYYGGSYVIVNAPVGAIVPQIPGGYISFMIGPMRYFYFGGTYYIHNGQQYEVVEPPPQAQHIVNTANQEMIIYPAKGQSQHQLNADRYSCHLWAVKQTGFDPSANNPNLSLKPDYDRAMSACLEAKGYVVK